LEERTALLVRQFLTRRSRENFSLLYRQCTEGLGRVALYLCQGRHSDADDLVQETWITAIEKLEQFQERSSFNTWITGILINKYREQQRKRNRLSTLEVVHRKQPEAGLSNLAIDLQQAIRQLPDGYREILTLHDIEGFKHREIAELLGIQEGTSKSQLFQARKTMRQLLTGYGERGTADGSR
jgi:RNA polymerase sigma-70 factor (ECF subfamily)